MTLPTTRDELEALIIILEPEALATLLPKSEPQKTTMAGALLEAVERHGRELSDDVLVRLAYAGLRSLADDHRFVLVCAEELITRGSEEGQNGFVNVVIQARDEYDPGHRAFAGTVLDHLIDDLLPRFGLKPLTTLLGALDFDVLSGPDGLPSCSGRHSRRSRESSRVTCWPRCADTAKTVAARRAT
jgi:hypothetical protein